MRLGSPPPVCGASEEFSAVFAQGRGCFHAQPTLNTPGDRPDPNGPTLGELAGPALVSLFGRDFESMSTSGTVRRVGEKAPTGSRRVGSLTQPTLADFSYPDKQSFIGPPGGVLRQDFLPRGEKPVDTWATEVESFVGIWQRKRAIGDRWAKGLRYTLGRIRGLAEAVGAPPKITCSTDLAEVHIVALRARKEWSRATAQFYFAGLRQFLRWAGNPVAEQSEIWRLPPATSSHRRWITERQLAQLLRGANGPSRLIVALEGFNGLRRVEVLRLRAVDVNLEEGWLNVRGKGRMGGKWRQIPLSEVARAELALRVRGIPPDSRILPYSASWADQQLAGAVKAANFGDPRLRISHHDLRRTFGRVAYAAGMDLVQLKNLFGHSSLEMSVHYIGLDLDRMREGLGQIDRALAPLVQGMARKKRNRPDRN
jgi:integrase